MTSIIHTVTGDKIFPGCDFELNRQQGTLRVYPEFRSSHTVGIYNWANIIGASQSEDDADE